MGSLGRSFDVTAVALPPCMNTGTQPLLRYIKPGATRCLRLRKVCLQVSFFACIIRITFYKSVSTLEHIV